MDCNVNESKNAFPKVMLCCNSYGPSKTDNFMIGKYLSAGLQ